MSMPVKTRVLVVDDDVGVRGLLERLLTFSNYDVTSASDGRDPTGEPGGERRGAARGDRTTAGFAAVHAGDRG